MTTAPNPTRTEEVRTMRLFASMDRLLMGALVLFLLQILPFFFGARDLARALNVQDGVSTGDVTPWTILALAASGVLLLGAVLCLAGAIGIRIYAHVTDIHRPDVG